MSVIEFEVGGQKYRAGKMDARKQFHVARRIAGSIGSGDIQSALMAVSGQSDEVFDYVIDACLSVVERNDTSGSWSRVLSAPNQDGYRMIMFEDIRDNLGLLVQVVAPVVEANVKGFLSALPSGFLPEIIGKAVSAKSTS